MSLYDGKILVKRIRLGFPPPLPPPPSSPTLYSDRIFIRKVPVGLDLDLANRQQRQFYSRLFSLCSVWKKENKENKEIFHFNLLVKTDYWKIYKLKFILFESFKFQLKARMFQSEIESRMNLCQMQKYFKSILDEFCINIRRSGRDVANTQILLIS